MARTEASVLPRSHFTQTAEGLIRHVSWISPYGELLLPVALMPDPVRPGELLRRKDGLPYPRKVGSKRVFVLPGGREVLR